jgi:hypothetical protein
MPDQVHALLAVDEMSEVKETRRVGYPEDQRALPAIAVDKNLAIVPARSEAFEVVIGDTLRRFETGVSA